MEEIKKCVRMFIAEEADIAAAELDDNESLFDNGILDSLGMVKLMAFIKDKFNLFAGASEVSMDNFDTINKISVYIAEKTAKTREK